MLSDEFWHAVREVAETPADAAALRDSAWIVWQECERVRADRAKRRKALPTLLAAVRSEALLVYLGLRAARPEDVERDAQRLALAAARMLAIKADKDRAKDAEARRRRRIAALRADLSDTDRPPAIPLPKAFAVCAARTPPRSLQIYSPRLRKWVPLLDDERAVRAIAGIFEDDEDA